MKTLAPPLSAGESVLPGYRVLTLLTRGRRMDTYDAWDVARDCRCVVKVLRPDRRHEQRVREAVRTEGEIVTTLAHPHLVRGYLASEEPPGVVLQTLGGHTLGALLDQGPVAVEDAALLGLQLASALGYLHQHGWLHLDVKPANVVVEHGQAVLIDLSLAGRPGSGRPGAGTRGYLAPEQALGEGLGSHTDVWGLGVTLLESLSGRLPYGDEATWESRRRLPLVRRRMPRLPADLPALVPESLALLLRACVDLRPTGRPTLAEVRAELTRYADLRS